MSGVYTFTPGEYSFEPGRIFYAVDSTTHELQSIEAEVEPESFVINVSSAPDLPVDTSKAKKAKSASQAMEEISVSPRTIHRVFTGAAATQISVINSTDVNWQRKQTPRQLRAWLLDQKLPLWNLSFWVSRTTNDRFN